MAEQNYETNGTMRREWTRLLEVPLNNRERQWLQERLEVLSVEEEAKLAAALLRTDPWTAQESVDCLLSLAEYQVCHPAGSYEALGRYALRYELSLPAELEEHVDLEKLGRRYEDFHPGVFVGRSYVEYPPGPPQAQYDGYTLPQEDLSWSVRLKLASPAVPEGVWVRLPDYSDVSGGPPGELDMALEALDVTLIQDCTLLEARCVLPEVQDLMDYEDLGKLIYDGQDLGFALDDAGRGLPDFWGCLAAGLELEHCRTLRQAADIAANARAYDLIPTDQVAEYGRAQLNRLNRDAEWSPPLAGCVDLDSYGTALLEQAGYQLNTLETAYIRRDAPAEQSQAQKQTEEQRQEQIQEQGMAMS